MSKFSAVTWLCAVFLLVSQARAFAVHQGCFVSVSDDVRAFSFQAAASDNMTVESCRQLAKARFVSSFALEAGRECWLDPLDSNIGQLTRFGAGDACTANCSGDSRIVCGGEQQVNIYVENNAGPVVVPHNDYTSVGCYNYVKTDDATSRGLTLRWSTTDNMTVDLCANVAYLEQALVFGVHGGSECWTGQDVDSAKALGVSTECTSACPGNSAQQCGGPLSLNLYALDKAPWLVMDAGSNTNTPHALVGAPAAPTVERSGSAAVVVSRGVAALAALLAAALLL